MGVVSGADAYDKIRKIKGATPATKLFLKSCSEFCKFDEVIRHWNSSERCHECHLRVLSYRRCRASRIYSKSLKLPETC